MRVFVVVLTASGSTSGAAETAAASPAAVSPGEVVSQGVTMTGEKDVSTDTKFSVVAVNPWETCSHVSGRCLKKHKRRHLE